MYKSRISVFIMKRCFEFAGKTKKDSENLSKTAYTNRYSHQVPVCWNL